MALAAIEGTETLTQFAERFVVHAHQISQSRSQTVARAAEVSAAAEDRRGAVTQVDLMALHTKIGQQALELDFLSSALGSLPARAQGDDRPDAPLGGHAAGYVARPVARLGLLHAPPRGGGRPGADAADRRTASGAPLCRQPDAPRSAARRRLRRRPRPHQHAHALHGDLGDVSPAADESATPRTPSSRIFCGRSRSIGRIRSGPPI